jgi:DNA invertase Pin-like site-specific DNA recombinase
MKGEKFFGYIRVSTVKQGEHGVSLQEQRDAITRYATRIGITIIEWFEEKETAAKRGRPIFNAMLRLLRTGKADGVVIHKIDRGARNLRDWADLVELIDQGVEVHAAAENLDLHSRGGRLTADIQAVVAADYIRNLREEIRKGFYGRLKQGLYPLPAPLGYTDGGKGRPKTIDPVRGPLVRQIFELYATGKFSLDTLTAEVERLGLRNRNGHPVARSALGVILNNHFYIGLIRIRRTQETFPGIHEPLIGKVLFDHVQAILEGRTNQRIQRHDFLFRRLITCKDCGRVLTGEAQKGHVYYRCHGRDCRGKSVREERVEDELLRVLLPLNLSPEECRYVQVKLAGRHAELLQARDARVESLRLNLERLKDRLARLTDAFIDGAVDKEIYEERKAGLLMERKDLQDQKAALDENPARIAEMVGEVFELAESVYLRYKLDSPEKKRLLLQRVTSNRWLQGKNVMFTLSLPFREIANREENSNGAPYRDNLRTVDELIDRLMKWAASPDATRFHESGKGVEFGKAEELAA